MPMSLKAVNRYRAFTLVELLVALTIIAVLMAILISGWSRLSTMVNTVSCSSNLRTLGMALHTYITENDGRFPPSRRRHGPNPSSPGQEQAQEHWIYSPYFGRSGTSEPTHRPIRFFDHPEPTGFYLSQPGRKHEDAGIFWCPADTDTSIRSVTFAAQSYGSNGNYIGAESAYPTDALTGEMKESGYEPSHGLLAAVPRPSEIIFAMDHEWPGHRIGQQYLSAGGWPFNSGASPKGPTNGTAQRVAFDRHGGKANALFLDGSVRQLVFEDIAGTGAKYLDPALQ